MITLDTRYKTRDGEFSATHDEAVDHCLATAQLQLIAALEGAGVDGAYRYAQKIVNNLYEGKNADSLNNIAAWVADALADPPYGGCPVAAKLDAQAKEIVKLTTEYQAEVDEFNAGCNAAEAGLPYDEPSDTKYDQWRVGGIRPAVIADLLACLDDIMLLADDYDGYETPDKLKELIDEISALAKTRKPLPGTY